MRHLGSILVLGSDSAEDRDACARLRVNGYAARHVASLDAAVSSFVQEHPDLVLILAGAETDAAAAIAGLRAAEGGETAPICLAVRPAGLAALPRADAQECDDYLAPPLYDAKLIAHLRPLLRLATMRAELRIRSAAAIRLGATPAGPPWRSEPIKALVVGEPGVAARAFDDLAIKRIDDPASAIDALHGGRFDLAVLAPGADAASYLDLCQRIRSSPSLFNLPVAVIGRPDARIEEASYNSGASAYFDPAAGEQAMAAYVRALARRQRTRLHLGRGLAATLTEHTRGLARAYSASFLATYLPERFDYAQRFGRHLAVLSIKSGDAVLARARYGEVQAEDLIRALEQWIAQLTRVEDLLAVTGEAEFAMVLPDTPHAEAAAVAARIAAVVGQVEFALTEVYEGVRAHVAVTGAVLKPGETMTDFVARSRVAPL